MSGHNAGVRLDVSLVHRLGSESVFNHDGGGANPASTSPLIQVRSTKTCRDFNFVQQAAVDCTLCSKGAVGLAGRIEQRPLLHIDVDQSRGSRSPLSPQPLRLSQRRTTSSARTGMS
jgi:hypothetical protein